MSMLGRYKKPGGFEQLLFLIEGCHKKRQEQLLGLVEAEDVQWAERIRAKMLDISKVIALPQSGINEIFSRLPEKILVFAMHGIPKEKHEIVLNTFTHFKKKTITELMDGTKPKAEEIEAAYLAIYKKIRELDKDRVISLEKLAPELSLSDKKAA